MSYARGTNTKELEAIVQQAQIYAVTSYKNYRRGTTDFHKEAAPYVKLLETFLDEQTRLARIDELKWTQDHWLDTEAYIERLAALERKDNA